MGKTCLGIWLFRTLVFHTLREDQGSQYTRANTHIYGSPFVTETVMGKGQYAEEMVPGQLYVHMERVKFDSFLVSSTT